MTEVAHNPDRHLIPSLVPAVTDDALLAYRQARTARQVVEVYIDDHAIRVTADGNPERIRGLTTFAGSVSRRPIDDKILRDEVVEFCQLNALRFTRVDITRAVSLTLMDRAERRRLEILTPLIEVEIDEDEQKRADLEFIRLAKLFDMREELCIACVRHFIWLVKRKQTRRTADHPLMLVVYNAIQGSGKSWFVERLIKQLQELASDGIPFSEIADARSAGLHKNAVAYLDDIGGAISRRLLGAVKSAITLSSSKRRDLGKSRQSRHEHDAVFIATSNENIHRLIPDESGHRRFAVLPFRNGAVEKGGDQNVRDIVNSLDYELLWKSVPVHAEAPIASVLAELHEFQLCYVPPHPLEPWLRNFDFASEAVRNITGPRGVRAQDLYALYREETGDIGMTDTALGRALAERHQRGALPMTKKRFGAGNFYVPLAGVSGVTQA